MSKNHPKKIETYLRGIEIQRIGNRAVHKAQEENRSRGIPNVCSRNGKIYYELPNGELTEDDPLNKEAIL